MRNVPAAAPTVTAGALMVATLQLFAAGQYQVEDAALVDPRTCELELWHSDYDDASFAAAGCRGEQPFDVTLEAELPRFGREAFDLEGKYLFREMDTHGYGAGLFAGAEYDTQTDRVEEIFLITPLTVEPVADRLTTHFNLGAVHLRDDRDTELFWGTGMALTVTGPLKAVAEIYGNEEDDPTVHGGFRLDLFDGQMDLDVTWFEDLESGGNSGWAAGVELEALRF